ncbi:MAG TPA: transcription antitermination factor NusB [Kiritimatiellae bacterium]|nr:transcription antitermination factor NusB [Kiritimatiellia bacterium]
MGTRRAARELALQFLFQQEFSNDDPEASLYAFWRERKVSGKVREFAEKLIRGVIRSRDEIDRLLEKCADNWALERMGTVERNVMRIALYEMLSCDDIPLVVSIDEAVDIAKEFCDRESGQFVNGVLDRALAELTGGGES